MLVRMRRQVVKVVMVLPSRDVVAGLWALGDRTLLNALVVQLLRYIFPIFRCLLFARKRGEVD